MVISTPFLLTGGKIKQSRIHEYTSFDDTKQMQSAHNTPPATDVRENHIRLLKQDLRIHAHNAMVLCMVAEKEARIAQDMARVAYSSLKDTK